MIRTRVHHVNHAQITWPGAWNASTQTRVKLKLQDIDLELVKAINFYRIKSQFFIFEKLICHTSFTFVSFAISRTLLVPFLQPKYHEYSLQKQCSYADHQTHDHWILKVPLQVPPRQSKATQKAHKHHSYKPNAKRHHEIHLLHFLLFLKSLLILEPFNVFSQRVVFPSCFLGWYLLKFFFKFFFPRFPIFFRLRVPLVHVIQGLFRLLLD